MSSVDEDKIKMMNGITEEVRRLLSDYMLILELKKRVEERLKEYEDARRRRGKRKKIIHGISSLRSTLRNLENRREVIVRTLEARIARALGELCINDLKVVPKHLARDTKTGKYYITTIEDSENIKTPIVIVIEIPNIELTKAEELVSMINSIISIFSKLGLSMVIILRRLRMRDVEFITALDILKRSGLSIEENDKEFKLIYNPEIGLEKI